MQRVILTVFMAVVVGASAGCGRQAGKTAGDQVVPVRVRPVELKDIKRALDYVANVTAQDEAVVYPKVTGKIVEKILEDGAAVKKGEVIALIDRDEVGLKFEKAPVESPLSGVIGRVYVDKGSSVTPQTPVALVVDMDRVRVRLDVPEKYLPSVTVGQKADISVDAWPSDVFNGTVVKVSPVVDTASRTAPVEIRIENADHRLKPGMFCRVRVVLEERKRVPAVTKEAVIVGERESIVYVAEGNIARRRVVTQGLREASDIEITEGLKEGDLVVVMGQQRLRDGMEVKPDVENQRNGGEIGARREEKSK